MVTVLTRESTFRAIDKHLHRRKTEQVVFLFSSVRHERDATIFEVADYYLVEQDELVFESEYHAEVTEEAQAKVIKTAWDKQLALGEIHSHPRDRTGVCFSPSDMAGFAEFVPHVWWRLKGKPYLAFVFGKNDLDGLAWITSPKEPIGVDRVEVGKRNLQPTGITVRLLQEKKNKEQARYSRQMALFGQIGQDKIGKIRVAIIGLGGLGSHVAQQLAYLGVKYYALIDEDVVSRSNLNRLVGATEADLGKKKVDVLARLIASIQPEAEISRMCQNLLSREAFAAIRLADLAFGCVDNDAVRLGLLEICCTYRKPYIDLATDVPEGETFGGRIIFTGLGKGCPLCLGELDQEEIQDFFLTPEERQERKRIYGVDRSALRDRGPSVVSLNAILASVGVTEFMAFATDLRKPFPFLTYRGGLGIVTRPSDAPTPNCYYCDAVWNGREKSDPYRYLKP